MLLPSTETEAADIIRDHAQASRALAIFGGNTRSGFGNRVEAEVSLSSRAITGIVAYNPAEMVMTVKAGTPVAEVEAALSAANQMMAFEPMDHRAVMSTAGEPTIGGVFAANVSGPRRFVAGAARDSLLGIRFINGQGEAIKAGGRVMKNVTGLDLVKLLAGSYGTLGFLTEVTFRVLPVPPAQTTLVISGLEDEAATHAMAAAMATSVEVSGAAHLPESVKSRFLDGSLPDGAATVLRLEGLAASVKARSQKLQTILSGLGSSVFLSEDDSKTLWRKIRDVTPYVANPAKPLWRVSVAPSQGHKLVAALRLEAGIDAFYDWQGGLVWMQMEYDPEADLISHHIRALGGGHSTLIRALPISRHGLAGFEPLLIAEHELSKRIKAKLDPAGIFNPGRMGR
ncbi:glycolate oxidase subunit GlcE [Agrobacterium rubi]|uniref:Glycolate oxidase subunit GlcE n=1 Tax=Agrobacterium rubi TaxID=28099 RepID=A0AAE7R3Z2_9HYPH|nr:glycolate oxidase subunit GlcE [Agrobacterium rubi]NTE85474.1 glycolate oxidase subunit GlcE [Agrobacterium rubi]NTF01406.1 glycolate oxidase subunit GlcE [Agrobacterium rubi]NTF35649.1 glycolate oxidase subunit GlcE [Agrobacterium rubi]OCJ48908.1 2-hydroxy-acid oxidase [Agrobacterium rubi]QTG01623.1 glycolate oxidase subunit GlcE [Agrobacterium rubi]